MFKRLFDVTEMQPASAIRSCKYNRGWFPCPGSLCSAPRTAPGAAARVGAVPLFMVCTRKGGHEGNSALFRGWVYMFNSHTDSCCFSQKLAEIITASGQDFIFILGITEPHIRYFSSTETRSLADLCSQTVLVNY